MGQIKTNFTRSLFSIMMILVVRLLHFGSSIEISEEEEMELFNQFKPLALEVIQKEHMKTDGYLLRWLYAFDYDLDKTIEALYKSLEWRKLNEIDNILTEDFSQLQKEFGTLIDGSVDVDGRPLLISAIGMLDVRKVVLAGQAEKYKRMFISGLELMENLIYYRTRSTTNAGNYTYKLQQAVGLFDSNGFSIKKAACQPCIKAIIELVRMIDPNYPALSYRTFGFNVARILHGPINVIKPFAASSTVKTLKIYGFDKDEWSRALLEQIPADQLLAQYGGTKLLRNGSGARNADKNLWNAITNETRLKVLAKIEMERQDKNDDSQPQQRGRGDSDQPPTPSSSTAYPLGSSSVEPIPSMFIGKNKMVSKTSSAANNGDKPRKISLIILLLSIIVIGLNKT